MYNGCANTYSISKGEKRVLLTTLNPSQAVQDQLAISKVTKESLFANKGEVKRALHTNETIYFLVAKEVFNEKEVVHLKLKELLEEFSVVFSRRNA